MIAEIVKNKKGKKCSAQDIAAEIKIAEQKAVGIGDVRKSDVKQNIFASPDCDGGLRKIKKNIIKGYRAISVMLTQKRSNVKTS